MPKSARPQSFAARLGAFFRSIGNCKRRWSEPEEEEDETPFWETVPLKKPPEDDVVVDKNRDSDDKTDREYAELPPGFELATALKDNGNDSFSKGHVEEAISIWFQSLDALHKPKDNEEEEPLPADVADANATDSTEATDSGGAGSPGPTKSDSPFSPERLAAAQSMLAGLPGGAPGGPLGGLLQAAAAQRAAMMGQQQEKEDPRVIELRATLFSNLALGNMKQKNYRQALNFCEEALHDQPDHKKALYRKADCLGELGELDKAEEVLVRYQEVGGEDAAKQAAQKREMWKKRSKAADDKQKKMWAGALNKDTIKKAAEKEAAAAAAAEPKPLELQVKSKVRIQGLKDTRFNDQEGICKEFDEDIGAWLISLQDGATKAVKKENLQVLENPPPSAGTATPEKKNGKKNKDVPAPAPKPAPKAPVLPAWTSPKISTMCVFDLRRKGIEWDDQNDFDDKIWRDGLGRTPISNYFRQALPLTVLGASALAELDLESNMTIHCFLDGNCAPFAEPHDWSLILKRCPHVRVIMVVYIDLGKTGDNTHHGGGNIPYGTLLQPVEEARIGDRTVHSTRFLGTYKEFLEHSRELPGIVSPQLVLWADVPLYGTGERDLKVCVEAYTLLANQNVPMIFTQESEIQENHGPSGGPWLGDSAKTTLAILDIGLGAKAKEGWYWNRFVIPLDQTERGILAGHAVVGVVRPKAPKNLTETSVLKALKDRQFEPSAHTLQAGLGPPPPAPAEQEMLREKWTQFCQKLEKEGRPVGPDVPEEERRKRMFEFHQFCHADSPLGMGPMGPMPGKGFGKGFGKMPFPGHR